MDLKELLQKIQSYTSDPNLELVKRAYQFAKQAHRNQYRVSGEPFINHPLGVAAILADLELDVTTIAAALLHDVLEDTDVTVQELEEEFGSEISLLVNGVTKLSKIAFKSKEERQAENLRKMLLAMAEDIRVILIKLADRLHNMRTLRFLKETKQQEKATETLEIYAPLAHRLGISTVKWELEDLAFRYLKPEMYYELADKLAVNRRQRERDIKKVIEILEGKLNEAKIDAEIYGRPKHLYSIYQKMIKQNKEFSEIYDLTAVRVIVNSIRECYQVLGIIHELWKPMPERFKDYIAMPKSNMYQSLHTTVIGPKGEPLEIQIRTWEMHRTAEYGIAAHWKYKEGKQNSESFERKLSWLRQILEWQKDLQDAHEFMEALKIDLFEDEVFVFTPKGDVISMPRGATPVDFAYHIHTEVGHNCVGAKVNGRIVPLEYELKNGDIVEVLTSSNSMPSRDWLGFVKTSRARSKIKRWFKRQRKEEVVSKGKELLEREIRRRNLNLREKEKEDKLQEIAWNLGYAQLEDLYESIGYGMSSLSSIISKLQPEKIEDILKETRNIPRKRKSPSKGVLVKGEEDLFVRISRCCNPVPGDEIIGYITRGRGVSVHRKDCPNLKDLMDNPERIIEVEWADKQEEAYQVELAIEALNRHGLLNEITTVLREARINLLSLNARARKDNSAQIRMTVELSSLAQMNNIINKLDIINGILKVERAKPT